MSDEIKIDQLVASSVQNVVGLNNLGNGTSELYIRTTPDKVETKSITFRPWLLISDPIFLDGFFGEFEIVPLAGDHFFSHRVEFADLGNYKDGLKHLKNATGKTPSAAGSPYKVYSDMELQMLIAGEFRLFSGLNFNSLLRMQIDLEVRTTPGFSFPNAEREDDAIIMVAMRDTTGWERLLSLDEMSEKEMLEKCMALIMERNPDVIEGHNIFNFDFPYIVARAKRHKVKLNCGRQGEKLSVRKSRFNAAERTIDYTRVDIPGRHVVDTLHMVTFYDVVKRELEAYGLKYVAKYFGVAAADRTYVEGDKITELFDTDPELLKKYAMDDVRETEAISNILLPSYFYQTQLTPISLQNCVVRGNATRIDSIFLAEYMRQGHSIPLPNMSQSFAGGLSESFVDGVFENVWHADVRSLYPSIIMAQELSPVQDRLGVFSKFLGSLRKFRLQAKDQMRAAESAQDKEYYNALQSTFKILINSFYGYLGFGYGAFNDFAVAEQVTATGRDLLRKMQAHLEGLGALVIEMDTDGLYFQPPAEYGAGDNAQTDRMEAEIQSILPEGIEVELDDTYLRMFGYKSKNYALLHYDGKVSLTGAALKSRGLEPFQRDFMRQLISLLLHDKADKVAPLYEEFRKKVQNRELPLSDFAKSETLARSPKVYSDNLASGKGRRAAAYELALKAEQEFRQGDQIRYYVTGDKKRVSVVENSKLFSPKIDDKDMNVVYYLGKLEELYKKFSQFASTKAESQQLELF